MGEGTEKLQEPEHQEDCFEICLQLMSEATPRNSRQCDWLHMSLTRATAIDMLKCTGESPQGLNSI